MNTHRREGKCYTTDSLEKTSLSSVILQAFQTWSSFCGSICFDISNESTFHHFLCFYHSVHRTRINLNNVLDSCKLTKLSAHLNIKSSSASRATTFGNNFQGRENVDEKWRRTQNFHPKYRSQDQFHSSLIFVSLSYRNINRCEGLSSWRWTRHVTIDCT